MAEYKIAVIRGDGIGVEVIEEGLKVLEAVGPAYDVSWRFTELPWSSERYLREGQMMSDDALDTLATFDAIYLGAVGHPDIQDHVTLNGLLLPIRRTFDQYVCERPSVLYPGVTSPLRDKEPWDIDMVVILLMFSDSVLPNWSAKMSDYGDIDVDSEGAGKTSGPQQLTGRADDPGPGGNPHGSERTPHQAHPGGL